MSMGKARLRRLMPSATVPPDGQRFLVNALAEDGEPTINVVTNRQKSISEQRAP